MIEIKNKSNKKRESINNNKSLNSGGMSTLFAGGGMIDGVDHWRVGWGVYFFLFFGGGLYTPTTTA